MHDSVRRQIILAIVLATYVVAGRLTVFFGFGSPGVAPVWAPTGIALTAFLLGGFWLWPAVFAGAFIIGLTTAGSVVTSLGFGLAQTLEGIAAVWLIRQVTGGADVFTSAPRIFRFTAVISLFSTPAGAAIGAASLAIGGFARWADFKTIWTTWWLGDLTGALVVTPVLVLWATTPRVRWRVLEALEAGALLLLLAVVAAVVFGGRLPSAVKNYPLEFLCGPFLVWAAFRFGRRDAAGVMAIVAAVAVWGTLDGNGPFVRQTAGESLMLLQAYLCVTAVTSLALASVVAEHKEAGILLRELSLTDSLTGLANYRRLIDVLRAEIARSDRTGRPFAVLFVDMNGLKSINDRYGHLAGSRALCRVAEALRGSCRSIDTTARFGGDEFAIVLPETGEIGGKEVAMRASQRLIAEGGRPVISISAGVAEYPRDGGTPAALLGAADRDLYTHREKAGGSRAKRWSPEAEMETPTLVGL
jgi:diguanylate cyclase (GGDEF)-like protein